MVQVQVEVANTDPSQVTSSNEHANANTNSAPVDTNDTDRLEAGSEMEAHDTSVAMVPDGGWGWIVVLGTFMIHVISDGIQYSFGVFVEDFVDYFECSKSALGGVGSLMIGAGWCSGNAGLLVTIINVISLLL